MGKLNVISGVLVIILCSVAHAHRPIFSEKAATDPNTAVFINQPSISQVIYREITEEAKQVWLAFDANEGFGLFIQIGVPVLDRLKEFRPAMLVIGPGLPEVDLPFKLPDGVGAKTFPTDSVEEPRFFKEHFTGTDSWILRSDSVTIPKSGRYYVVAYVPSGDKGKLWLSVGKQESFGLAEWAKFGEWKKKIRKFHEISEAGGGLRIPILSDIGDMLKSGGSLKSSAEKDSDITPVSLSTRNTLEYKFYTQIGVDSTWKSIIDGKKIPIGTNSTQGITGSIVDVNNALVEQVTYGNRPIEKEISIHTPGNSVIRRKDFPKWTRWYQEDGNTQVFRMFEGEYNVRNTRNAAARIESFSNHKWKRGGGWQEWTGTYTIVQPVVGSIFQVKNRINDWAVMLTTNANGDIRLQPRHGKYRIVARAMKGKSFDLRVRDDGHNYEVYIDGQKVGDGAYNRPEGYTSFRWGMYFGKRIPKSDTLIFVTGAAVNPPTSPNTSATSPY